MGLAFGSKNLERNFTKDESSRLWVVTARAPSFAGARVNARERETAIDYMMCFVKTFPLLIYTTASRTLDEHRKSAFASNYHRHVENVCIYRDSLLLLFFSSSHPRCTRSGCACVRTYWHSILPDIQIECRQIQMLLFTLIERHFVQLLKTFWLCNYGANERTKSEKAQLW